MRRFVNRLKEGGKAIEPPIKATPIVAEYERGIKGEERKEEENARKKLTREKDAEVAQEDGGSLNTRQKLKKG